MTWLDHSRHCPLCRAELYEKGKYMPPASALVLLEYGDSLTWIDPPQLDFDYTRMQPEVTHRIREFNTMTCRQKWNARPRNARHIVGHQRLYQSTVLFLATTKTEQITARFTRRETAKTKHFTPDMSGKVREQIFYHLNMPNQVATTWIAEGEARSTLTRLDITCDLEFLRKYMNLILRALVHEYHWWISILPEPVFEIINDTLSEKSEVIAELMRAAKREEREWPWIKVVGANGEDEKLAPWPNPITD